MIGSGVVSAARITSSEVPRLSVLVVYLLVATRTDRKSTNLVSTLLELAVVGGALDEVEELLGESLVGDGPGWKSQLGF